MLHGRTIALMNSQEPWLSAQGTCKIKQLSIPEWSGERCIAFTPNWGGLDDSGHLGRESVSVASARWTVPVELNWSELVIKKKKDKKLMDSETRDVATRIWELLGEELED